MYSIKYDLLGKPLELNLLSLIQSLDVLIPL